MKTLFLFRFYSWNTLSRARFGVIVILLVSSLRSSCLVAQRPSHVSLQWRDVVSQTYPGDIVAAPDGSALILANHAERQIYRSTDDGATWELVRVPFSSLDWGVHLFATTGSHIFTMPAALPSSTPFITISLPRKIYRSSNGGQAWTEQIISAPAGSLTFVRQLYASGERLFAIASGLDLLSSEQRIFGAHRSADSGVTWASVAEGLPTIVASNEQLQGVGGVSGIAATENGEGRETLVLSHFGRGEYIVSPEAGVYRSTDGGARWSKAFDDNGRPFVGIAASGSLLAAVSHDPVSRNREARVFFRGTRAKHGVKLASRCLQRLSRV
jgi:hypothetical protein